MARLIDIAKAAGVSEATVSRVLNGRSGVNEATRRSVIETARRLGREVGTAATRSFQLESSDDGVAWVLRDLVEDNEEATVTRAVAPFSARYVRVLVRQDRKSVV